MHNFRLCTILSIGENHVLYTSCSGNHITTISQFFLCNSKAILYFLRTRNGVEIDIIIDRKNHKEWIEIKKSETFRPAMAKALHEFVGENDLGFILYKGKSERYESPISILNYQGAIKTTIELNEQEGRNFLYLKTFAGQGHPKSLQVCTCGMFSNKN